MNETINYGRNKFTYKYEVCYNGITKKYCSIVDICHDPFLEGLDLNRQKLYRLRNNQYSIKKNTTATALEKKGYNQITIKAI